MTQTEKNDKDEPPKKRQKISKNENENIQNESVSNDGKGKDKINKKHKHKNKNKNRIKKSKSKGDSVPLLESHPSLLGNKSSSVDNLEKLSNQMCSPPRIFNNVSNTNTNSNTTNRDTGIAYVDRLVQSNNKHSIVSALKICECFVNHETFIQDCQFNLGYCRLLHKFGKTEIEKENGRKLEKIGDIQKEIEVKQNEIQLIRESINLALIDNEITIKGQGTNRNKER